MSPTARISLAYVRTKGPSLFCRKSLAWTLLACSRTIWEFPKIRGTFTLGSLLIRILLFIRYYIRVPIFRNSHIKVSEGLLTEGPAVLLQPSLEPDMCAQLPVGPLVPAGAASTGRGPKHGQTFSDDSWSEAHAEHHRGRLVASPSWLCRVPRPSIATWEFPKIRGTLFWGPYNKDPTM